MGAAEACIFIGAALASLHSSIRDIAMGGLAFLLCFVTFALANDSNYASSYTTGAIAHSYIFIGADPPINISKLSISLFSI